MESPQTMTSLGAIDLIRLPNSVLEDILTLGIRCAAPSMRQPGVSIDLAARRLTPFLHALRRSRAPRVSYAFIMECPWIDANLASLTNNLWLLDTLAFRLTNAPFHRPMQYRDWDLLDQVSAKGFISVLNWWHKSEFFIGHTDPLQNASDHGHVTVLQWWLDSRRLGKAFPANEYSLLEPTRKGDLEVLDWWLEHVLLHGVDCVTDIPKDEWPRFLTHGYVDAIAVACHAQQHKAMEWWLDLCMRCRGMTRAVMGVLFGSGIMDLVVKYLPKYHDKQGLLFEVLPFAVFSGSAEFVQECMAHCDMLDSMPAESWSGVAGVYASCAGHVYVLEWMRSQGWVDTSQLDSQVSQDNEAFCCLVPEQLTAEIVELDEGELSLLDILALQGHSAVLEWWADFDKRAVCSQLQKDDQLHRCIGFALRNNHVAFLDLLLDLLGMARVKQQTHATMELVVGRGHLAATRWYWDKLKLSASGGCDVDHARFEIMQATLHSAFLAKQLDIVEWMISAWGRYSAVQKNKQLAGAVGQVIVAVLDDGPNGWTAEWVWNNASRLGLSGELYVQVHHYDPYIGDYSSRRTPLQPVDFWSLMCLIGACTKNGKVTFMTSFVSEDLVVGFLKAWKGYPLFLERLLGKGSVGVLRKGVMYRNHWHGMDCSLNLDLACQAGAGIAVYDWMHSAYNKCGGGCTWTPTGYYHLKRRQDKRGMKWWKSEDLAV